MALKAGQNLDPTFGNTPLQNHMRNEVGWTADDDRLVLRRILGFYDTCDPDAPKLTVVS